MKQAGAWNVIGFSGDEKRTNPLALDLRAGGFEVFPIAKLFDLPSNAWYPSILIRENLLAEPFAAWAANVFYTLSGVQVLQWSDAAFFYAPTDNWLRPDHFAQRLEVERLGAPYRMIWTRDEGCLDRPIITPKNRRSKHVSAIILPIPRSRLHFVIGSVLGSALHKRVPRPKQYTCGRWNSGDPESVSSLSRRRTLIGERRRDFQVAENRRSRLSPAKKSGLRR